MYLDLLIFSQARGRPSEDGNWELVRQEMPSSVDGLHSDGGAPAGLSPGGVFCSEGCLQRRTYGYTSGLPRIRCKQLEINFVEKAYGHGVFYLCLGAR